MLEAYQVTCSSFEEGIRAAIGAGGDTDTVASIAGQIAGAAGGLDGMPLIKLDQTPEGRECIALARKFAEAVAPGA